MMALNEAADRENVGGRPIENEERRRLGSEDFFDDVVPLFGPEVGSVARSMPHVGVDQRLYDLRMRAGMIVAPETALHAFFRSFHLGAPLKRKR